MTSLRAGSLMVYAAVLLAGLLWGGWLCRRAPDPRLWRFRKEGSTIDPTSLVHDQPWHFWQFDAFAPAEAQLELPATSENAGGPAVARVVVVRDNPSASGSIRLLRRVKAVPAATGLKVRLAARATAPRPIAVRWTTVELQPRSLAPDQTLQLSTDWQQFELVFPPAGDQERAAVAILLAQAAGTVELRDVHCTFQ